MCSPTIRLCIGALLLAGCRLDNEAEHLEHEIPAHKPANTADALDQIESRCAELGDLSAADANRRDERLRELVEIVRWLPEIAGDSDLPEREWNAIDRLSQELPPRLQAVAKDRNERAIADLQAFVKQSVERLRPSILQKPTSARTPETM